MGPLEVPGIDELLTRALAEDVGQGDITTAATVDDDQRGRARVTVKESSIILCGGSIFERVFARTGASAKQISLAPEGAALKQDEIAAEFEGLLAGLLSAERTALNLVQLMSGIATLTSQYVDAIAGTRARIVDTRKTHPGLRALEKYAVRIGGGDNHRFGLDSGVLIKENHIAAAGSVAAALKRARRRAPHTFKIEIECETLDQVKDAISNGADIVLLDNMSLGQIRNAVRIADGRAILEVSGGVSLPTVRAIAETGVDLISAGALTHSARSVDLSMRIEVA
ncbi:MAG TPA: carboxylating nicotinate-nucleotide diphosphorylase [Candidatus Binataceae bacterium]